MTPEPVQLGAGESLDSFLTRGGSLSADRSLEIVLVATKEIAALHSAGRLHLAISAEAIFLDGDGAIHMVPPQEGQTFGSSRLRDDGTPAALRRDGELKVPSQVEAAERVLAKAGISLQPTQIDVYQLGALLCRLISGEPISSYLRSPRTKGRVPAAVQSLIEKCLGQDQDSANSFLDASELLPALGGVLAINQQTLPGATRRNSVVVADQDTAHSLAPGGIADDTAVESTGAPAGRRGDSPPFPTLGHYRIDARIGRGGMGDVYKAYEAALDRTVAIKVLPADFSREPDFVRRFYAEATAAAKLHHPNIVQVHYIGEDRGHHFFAMQFIDGESLGQLLARRGRLTPNEALAVMEHVLAGLAAAHNAGLIHRDIKPGNILLDKASRRALLADFGLVKSIQSSGGGLTATGMVMGTVDYISPEQGRGHAVDARSDLYSMGVVLYEVLSGKLPFAADSPTATIFQHVYETALALHEVAPDVPEPLSRIVEKLMCKSPTERYQTAEELIADLRAFRGGMALPSGADVQDGGKSRADQVATQAAGERRVTRVIAAPNFREMPPPSGLEEIAPTGRWQRVRNRLFDAVQQRAPGLIEHLRNTQQQVDGAVEEYSRRHRQLARLIFEAQGVRQELESQRAAWNAAAAEAKAKPGRAADDEVERARDAAKELEQQIALQDDELASMRLRKAQMVATLERLRSQRDLLVARLKVAEARVHVDGGVRSARRRGRLLPSTWPKPVQTAVLLMLCATAGLIFYDKLYRKKVDLSDDDRGTPIAPRFTLADGPPGLVSTFAVKVGQVYSVAMSPDNRYVASASFDLASDPNGRFVDLSLWNIQTGKLARQLSDHKVRSVKQMEFSPDGRRLAVLSQDGLFFFWDVATGDRIKTGDYATNGASLGGKTERFAYLEGTEKIAVAGMGCSVFDTTTLNPVARWSDNSGRMQAIATFADGLRVACGGSEPGVVKIWSVPSLAEVQRIILPERKPVDLIVVSRDGRWLLAGARGRLYLWDVESDSLVNSWKPDREDDSHRATISPDGRQVLYVDARSLTELVVRDSASNSNETPRAFQDHIGPIRSIQISADGTHVVSGSDDGSVKLWRLPHPVSWEQLARDWLARVGGKFEARRVPSRPTLNDATGSFPSLYQVTLRDNTNVRDDDLINLAGLTELENLDLAGTSITDRGLYQVQSFESLRVLSLEGTKVTDSGVEQLARLKQLDVLNLSNTGITDASLAQLAKTNLTSLYLDSTKITDAGLNSLKAMRGLQRLSLKECKLSPAAVEQLKKDSSIEKITFASE